MLPSRFSELGDYPQLRLLVADQVDMQFADLRVLLRLPLEGLESGCNFVTAHALLSIIAGTSVCFFEPSEQGLADRRDRGRRFKELLSAFYPWGDDYLDPNSCVDVLYDTARNPLTHSLGIGLPALSSAVFQVSILKWPLDEARIIELEESAVRPRWTRPTIDEPRVPQARGEVVLCIPTLYWGVHRMLHGLFARERHAEAAEALVGALRTRWAPYALH